MLCDYRAVRRDQYAQGCSLDRDDRSMPQSEPLAITERSYEATRPYDEAMKTGMPRRKT